MILFLRFLPLLLSIFVMRTAEGRSCGKVVFNCDTHKMTLNGRSSTINCGRATASWKGKIGSPGKAAGSVFKSMKGAPMVTLVPPPNNANIVVHLMPPKSGKTPVGHNRSAGCIHVGPKQLKELAQCRGTPYQVIFKTKGRYKAETKSTKKKNSWFGSKKKDEKKNKKKKKLPWEIRRDEATP